MAPATLGHAPIRHSRQSSPQCSRSSPDDLQRPPEASVQPVRVGRDLQRDVRDAARGAVPPHGDAQRPQQPGTAPVFHRDGEDGDVGRSAPAVAGGRRATPARRAAARPKSPVRVEGRQRGCRRRRRRSGRRWARSPATGSPASSSARRRSPPAARSGARSRSVSHMPNRYLPTLSHFTHSLCPAALLRAHSHRMTSCPLPR